MLRFFRLRSRLSLTQTAEDKLKDLVQEQDRQIAMLQETEDIVTSEDPSPEEKSSEELQALIDNYEVRDCFVT